MEALASFSVPQKPSRPLKRLRDLPLLGSFESTGQIHHDPLARTFRLEAKESMYVLRVDENLRLEHVHWGPKLGFDDISFLRSGMDELFAPGYSPQQPLIEFFQLKQFTAQELLSNWRKYRSFQWQTSLNERDLADPLKLRRLENATWRLFFKYRASDESQPHTLDDRVGGRVSQLAKPSPQNTAREVGSDDEGDNGRSRVTAGSPHIIKRKTQLSSLSSLDLSDHTVKGKKKVPAGNTKLAQPPIQPAPQADKPRRSSSPTRTRPQAHGGDDLAQSVREVFGKASQTLEVSDLGTGDYRSPTLIVEAPDGSRLSPLLYKSHSIAKGKLAENDLMDGSSSTSSLNLSSQTHPHIRCEDEDEATTLVVEMEDELTGLVVYLLYTVYRDYDIITRQMVFHNTSTFANLTLIKTMSMTVDFNPEVVPFYLTSLSGNWARERHMVTKQIAEGTQSIQSVRGASGHQHNPFMIISSDKPNEDSGTIFAFNLVYSGNFLGEAEMSENGRLRINMGINPTNFRWTLKPNCRFTTPECVMCFSSAGMGHMSRQLHRFYRNRLMPKRIHSTPSFILLNSWEPCYFNVSHDAVLELAEAAAKAEIDMIVLDDGWFGNRNNDRSSLGDWFPSSEKFPQGLHALVSQVNKLGVKFGLWVEPEMVSVDSELYRKHSDWCLHHKGRSRTEGRNQLVLDLSRKVVRDYIYNTLRKLLRSANIEYVKWDMNRHHTEVYSHNWSPSQQGEISHRYICGLYEILHRLHEDFPTVVFETCSGGGGRFDPAMLFYSNQIWASDNTDAICRVPIFYGTSIAYPTCAIGAHVSTSPNHQTHRTSTLKLRSLVAFCGTFGYELNPKEWTQHELEEVKAYNHQFKEISHIIKWGDLYRLWDPFATPYAAWMFVSESKLEAVVFAVLLGETVGHRTPRLKLKGLLERDIYVIDEIAPGRFRRNEVGQVMFDTAKQDRIHSALSALTLCNAGLPLIFATNGDCVMLRLRSVGMAAPQPGFSVGGQHDESVAKDSMYLVETSQTLEEEDVHHTVL